MATSRVRVAASDLTREGFTYTIALVVTDFVGTQSAEVLKDVYRSSLALPTMGIAQPSYSLLEHGQALYLQGSAEFSACAENEELVFSWAMEAFDLNGNAVGAAGEDVQSAGRTFAASNLQAGTLYQFTLQGFPSSQPFNIGATFVTVEVLLPELHVAIAGGNRKVSSLRELVVASDILSGEPPEAFNFEWGCSSNLAGGGCRNKVTNQLITLENAAMLVIEADVLLEGQYSFFVQVQDVPASGTLAAARIRHAQAAAIVDVVDFVLPEVTVAIDRVATPISPGGTVNTDTKIAITRSIHPFI